MSMSTHHPAPVVYENAICPEHGGDYDYTCEPCLAHVERLCKPPPQEGAVAVVVDARTALKLIETIRTLLRRKAE